MKKEYFVRLDFIRIVSCILILFYHLGIIKGGFLPVCTFFALSGYLSCNKVLKSDNFSVKSYYLKRLKAIYLPLIVVVSLTILLYKVISPVAWLSLKPETLSVVFGYNNFWQLSAHFDYFTRNINTPFVHLWFISILMQFDLIFPLAVIGLKKCNEKYNKNFSLYAVLTLTVLSTVLFIVLSKTQNIMVAYYNSFARSFSIFFGILWAMLVNKFNFELPKTLKKYSKLIFLAYSIILILMCFFVSADSKHYALFMIIATLISIRLIRYATVRYNANKEKEQIVKFFAKGLYNVYLVQYPVIFFMQGVPIFRFLKVINIITLTIILAYAIYIAMNIKFKDSFKKGLRAVLMCALIISSVFVVACEKDHSAEMKELENRLTENEKLVEEKKNEFLSETDTDTENSDTQSAVTTTTTATTTTMLNDEQIAENVHNMQLVGVGDSLLLDAIDEFYNQFPNAYFDGKMSRSLYAGEDVLQELKNEGKLADTLVLCLSQNGDFSTRHCEKLMEIVENRTVYWVNAVGADDPEYNDRFKAFAQNYPNIHIVDWAAASKPHPEYFYPDKIHTNPTGIKAYVNTVYETILENYKAEYKANNNTPAS